MMWVLAVRFGRSRTLAWTNLIVAVTAAVLIAMYVAMQAFTLSGAQVADRDLGRRSNLLDLSGAGSLKAGETGLADTAYWAAAGAGAADPGLAITSLDVKLDTARPPLTLFYETDWSADPFPGRYILTHGRWPNRPGEVVLTRRAVAAVGDVTSLPVMSGNERLQVVGVATDRYDSLARILAAPGTWAAFKPTTAERFTTLRATATLTWDGDTDGVLAAVRTALGGDDLAVALGQGLRTRANEMAQARRSWVERIPIAYTIPSLALPVLAVLTVFGLNRRRFRRNLRVLTSVGVGRGAASAAMTVATTSWALAGTAAGGVVGVGPGAAVRPLCDLVLAGPISPMADPAVPLLRLLLVAALGCLLGGLVLATTTVRAERAAPRAARGGRLLTTARRWAALLAGLAAVGQIVTLDTVPKAMIFAGTAGLALLLITPELVHLALRLVPTRDPRARLGVRQLAHDRDRAVAGIAVLTAALGAPLCMLTLLATLITSAEADIVPEAPPHQVVLSAAGGRFHPPSPAVVSAVTARVAFDRPPIQLGYLYTDTAVVTVQGGSRLGTVLVVDSPDAVARLNGGALSPAQAALLRDGGILTWEGAATGERALIVHDPRTDAVTATTRPLPAGRIAFEPSWTRSTSGVLLTSTAQGLGLDVRRGGLVYTGATDQQAHAARQAVIDAGLDPYEITIYEPPQPVAVPPAYYSAALGLALVVLLTTMTVARAQVHTLRGYVGRLIAVGVPPRWVRQVLLLQSAVIVATGTVFALNLAVLPVVVAVLRMPALTLSVPWSWLGVVIAAFYAATGLATLLSSRSLRAVVRAD
ncbi:hypothetical protein [Dactylosporangium sp. CS-033363]|uniref:hypothetical protein n=1 Tax=Dactylosporangium sp. CS-033363 TaxID=3239935 RepID=UPI003D94118E